MTLSLADQLLLLALDDEKGTVPTSVRIGGALAAALIMDLIRRGVLALDEGDDFVVAEVPRGLPQPLEAAARTIHDAEPRRGVSVWILRLPNELKPIRARVAAPLVARGILSEQRSNLLGLVARTSYPEANSSFERALREGLRGALMDQREPTEDETLLMPLLHSLNLVAPLVSKGERQEAKTRAAELAVRGPASDALVASAAAAQAAALAVTLASSHVGMLGGDAGGGGGDGGGG